MVVAAVWLGVMARKSRTDIQIEDAWVQETNEWRAVIHLKIVSTGKIADRIVRGSATHGTSGALSGMVLVHLLPRRCGSRAAHAP